MSCDVNTCLTRHSEEFFFLIRLPSSLHSFIIMSFTSANGWSDNIKGENIYNNCTTECFASEDVLTKWTKLPENPFFIAICGATRFSEKCKFRLRIFHLFQIHVVTKPRGISERLSRHNYEEACGIHNDLEISQKTLELDFLPSENFQVLSIFWLREQPWIETRWSWEQRPA